MENLWVDILLVVVIKDKSKIVRHHCIRIAVLSKEGVNIFAFDDRALDVLVHCH